MISYIRGELTEVSEGFVVVEANQIGYNIVVTANTCSLLPPLRSEVKIYTFFSVKEDSMSLFGFLSKEEVSFFRLLLSVNGIGPKGALNILDIMPVSQLKFAILSEDIKTLSKAPGVGTKTAQRLVLDLKDKINIEEMIQPKEDVTDKTMPEFTMNGLKKDAVEALQALGYSGADSLKAVSRVEEQEGMTVEEILKAALKNMIL